MLPVRIGKAQSIQIRIRTALAMTDEQLLQNAACLFQPVSTVHAAAHRQLAVEEEESTVLGTNRCVSRDGKLKEKFQMRLGSSWRKNTKLLS